MSVDKIRQYNTQIRSIIDQRDFNNPDIKKYIKIQKVISFLTLAHDI